MPPVLSVSPYLAGECGIPVNTEIHKSPDGPLADTNRPCKMSRLPCPLVAPKAVAVWPVRGATGVVTTECSAPVYTIKVIDWPLTFIMTVGSRGPRIREPGLP